MLNEVKSRKAGRKIISFMHLSLYGFVAGTNGVLLVHLLVGNIGLSVFSKGTSLQIADGN